MVTGKKIRIPFDRYSMPNFEVSTYHRDISYDTCGSGALSMLTGVNPQLIDKRLPRGQEHWTTTAMKSYLRKRRWRITDVTVNAVTNVFWTHFPLNEEHLLLLACQMDNEDMSWLVAHKGKIHHNFEISSFTGLYLVNKPVQECYLLQHKC